MTLLLYIHLFDLSVKESL